MWDDKKVAPHFVLYFHTNKSHDIHIFPGFIGIQWHPAPLLQHSCIVSICHNFSYAAISQLPPPSQITHISQFNNAGSSQAGNMISIPSLADRGSPNDNTSTDQQNKDPSVIHIGAALPPISTKPFKQIEQGNFIEMEELLLESLRHLASVSD